MRLVRLVSMMMCVACGVGVAVDSPDAGDEPSAPPDAGGVDDAGPRDGGGISAGDGDAGSHDAGEADAGEADAGGSDAGAFDAGISGTGSHDAGPHDAGVPDAGLHDGGTHDAGAPDAGTPGGGLPLTFFGQNWNSSAHVPTVSFGALRLWDTGTTWAEVETSSGTYDWSALDAWLSLAATHGKDVIYTFGRTPQWISARPTEHCSHGNVGCAAPPSDLANGNATFKAFVTKLVQHSLASPTAHIRYYEIWNEANLSTMFWSGTVQELVTMANDAYAIIHQLDPNARVISPSSSGGTSVALNGFYISYFTSGGGTPMDIAAYHGYLAPNDPAEGIVNILTRLNNLKAMNGAASKPLWITEGSWGDAPNLTDDQQAAWLAEQYLFMWANGVERYYWYSWDNNAWGTLWDATRGVHPAGIAYGVLAGWLVGSHHGGTPCAKASDATWTCTLTLANGSPAQILWNATATKLHPTAFASYATLDGATHAVSGGMVTVEPRPVLVR
jgi:hypothetical protein